MSDSDTKDPVYLLRIGKTGSTYLRAVLRHNMESAENPVIFLKHGQTLQMSAARFGPNRKFAFVFREPSERFVSAFNSRLRRGRPQFNRMWSTEEAITFQYFASANALAEALYSDDERLQSAAAFAMQSIKHITMNMKYYFGNRAALMSAAENLVCCIDLKDLTKSLTPFMRQMGYHKFAIPDDISKHESPLPGEKLSALAQQNLRTFWRKEYQIYEACQILAHRTSKSIAN